MRLIAINHLTALKKYILVSESFLIWLYSCRP